MQVSDQITFVKTIADRLKYARSRLDPVPSQEDVARRAGVSQGTIGNIEGGARKSPRGLLAIAAAVGVNPQWLATGEGPMASSGSLTLTPGTAEVRVTGYAPTVTVAAALPVVLGALSGLTPGQWAMVRARLDAMPGHPEADEDVAGDVLPLLQPAPAKRQGSA